jgi:hypothetical protein
MADGLLTPMGSARFERIATASGHLSTCLLVGPKSRAALEDLYNAVEELFTETERRIARAEARAARYETIAARLAKRLETDG